MQNVTDSSESQGLDYNLVVNELHTGERTAEQSRDPQSRSRPSTVHGASDFFNSAHTNRGNSHHSRHHSVHAERGSSVPYIEEGCLDTSLYAQLGSRTDTPRQAALQEALLIRNNPQNDSSHHGHSRHYTTQRSRSIAGDPSHRTLRADSLNAQPSGLIRTSTQGAHATGAVNLEDPASLENIKGLKDQVDVRETPGGTIVTFNGLYNPIAAGRDHVEASARAWWTAYFRKWKGVHGQKAPPIDTAWHMLWSWIGAFISILAIALIHQYLSPEMNLPLIVASFGASAVLLFGVPDGKLSQPRNFVGGHVFSALIGISVRNIFPDHLVALSTAFGMACALLGMQLTKTVHPPGGATALVASSAIMIGEWYGFKFVLTILFACTVMLLVALGVNNISNDRRYPMYWLG